MCLKNHPHSLNFILIKTQTPVKKLGIQMDRDKECWDCFVLNYLEAEHIRWWSNWKWEGLGPHDASRVYQPAPHGYCGPVGSTGKKHHSALILLWKPILNIQHGSWLFLGEEARTSSIRKLVLNGNIGEEGDHKGNGLLSKAEGLILFSSHCFTGSDTFCFYVWGFL